MSGHLNVLTVYPQRKHWNSVALLTEIFLKSTNKCLMSDFGSLLYWWGIQYP